MCLSVPQIAVAPTRITKSSGPGAGFGQSRTSVPSGPSRGFALTTAIIAPESTANAQRCRWGTSRARRRCRSAQVTPHVTERRVDPLVDGTRRLFIREGYVVRRKFGCEAVDLPDQLLRIAHEAVLVHSTVDDVEPLR